MIGDAYLLKQKTWHDIEEDDPLSDEIAIFEEAIKEIEKLATKDGDE